MDCWKLSLDMADSESELEDFSGLLKPESFHGSLLESKKGRFYVRVGGSLLKSDFLLSTKRKSDFFV